MTGILLPDGFTVEIPDDPYQAFLDVAQTWTADQTFALSTQLSFRDSDNFIHSNTDDQITINAVDLIKFGLSGINELQLSGELLKFIQGANSVALNWATTSELDVEIDDTAEYTFTANDFYPVTTDAQDSGLATNRWDGTYSQFTNSSHATDPSSQVANFWYSEADKAHKLECDAGILYDVCAFQGPVADSVVADTTTKTAFTQTYDIAANSLVAGTTYEFWFSGDLSTDASIDYEWFLAGDAVSILATGVAAQTAVSAKSWFVHGYFTCRSIGASGTIQANAVFGYNRAGSIPALTSLLSTHDTTQVITIAAQVQMSVAGLGKSATMKQFILKKLT